MLQQYKLDHKIVYQSSQDMVSLQRGSTVVYH